MSALNKSLVPLAIVAHVGNRSRVPVSIPCNLGTVSDAGSIALTYFHKKFQLTGVKLLDGAGIAANDTNYVTLAVMNGAATLATLDTRAAGQGAVTALVGKAFDIEGTDTEKTIAAGSSIHVVYAEGGTGTTTLAKIVLEGYFETIEPADDYPLVTLDKNFVLTGCKLINRAAIAASNSDYVTLTLKNGATVLGTLDTRAANQGAVTALVKAAFAMTAETQDVAAASTLKLTYAEAGTGNIDHAQIVIEGYWK
jgi:hypothetical protein